MTAAARSNPTPFDAVDGTEKGVAKAAFDEEGYVILRGFWPPAMLAELERSIVHFYAMQALKIEPLRQRLGRGRRPEHFSTVEDLDEVIAALEEEDKEAAYQTIHMINNSVAARRLSAYQGLVGIVEMLLDCPASMLFFAGPQPFVNMPSAKRLLYRWHSERHFLPKRRNFVNLWFPLFRPKSEGHGTMAVMPRSHRKHFDDFIEYSGYDRETFGRRNHFRQYEIPEAELREFEPVMIEAEPGDVVMFQPNLAHSSTVNGGGTITYTGVMRVLDVRNDLTLSGSPNVLPYGGGDYGRPGLVTIDGD